MSGLWRREEEDPRVWPVLNPREVQGLREVATLHGGEKTCTHLVCPGSCPVSKTMPHRERGNSSWSGGSENSWACQSQHQCRPHLLLPTPLNHSSNPDHRLFLQWYTGHPRQGDGELFGQALNPNGAPQLVLPAAFQLSLNDNKYCIKWKPREVTGLARNQAGLQSQPSCCR